MTEPCKIWAGALTREDGYGQWPNLEYPTRLAHRIVFFQTYGWWPEVVRHSCDTPACVEPTHLLAGTHQDNKDDAVERGRHARGETAGRAKLTSAEVAALREQSSATHRELADQYGISRSQVQRILYRKQRQEV